MDIALKPTTRGFLDGHFIDRYRNDCSIQESSLATERCIWLGVHENRLHLTQIMAAELIPLLKRFVATGGLREDAPAPPASEKTESRDV